MRNLLILSGLFAAAVALPASANSVTADFENFAHLHAVTTDYVAQGIDFTPLILGAEAPVILRVPFYNSLNFPPHSGLNVAYAPETGMLNAHAIGGAWDSVGVWASVSYSPLTLTVFDANGLVLGTDSIGSSLAGTVFLHVEAADIASITLTGAPDLFAIDDFTITRGVVSASSTAVPEPLSAVLLASGLFGLIQARRRQA